MCCAIKQSANHILLRDYRSRKVEMRMELDAHRSHHFY